MACQPGRRYLLSLVLRGWLGACVVLGVSRGVAQVAGQIGKNHQQVKRQFRSVIARANRSAVRIFSSDQLQDVALGTLVGRGNYVLTRASLLHGDLRCQLANQRSIDARRVATIEARDVALLRLAEDAFPPVTWSRGPLPPVGSLLVTAGRGPDPIAIGVVSVPGSIANGHGIWHDSILRPNDCGGPLVDLTGHVVGINMASGERVTSLALSASSVQAILEQLAADHKELADLHVDRPDPPARPSVEEPNDLQKFEAKIRLVATRAIACTVGLRIGRTMGSGVIISDDGYVLTAAHVSRQAGLPVKIFLADGRTAAGKTLGANHTTDAGLIRIETPGPWPHATRAARGRAGPAATAGRWCVATGHPSGYQPGRPPVLRLGRILSAARDAIVTDCVLKQGDSGGPLFDIEGNLLGIHERIGRGLANNVHLPLLLFHTDWSRLVRGDVWGSQ